MLFSNYELPDLNIIEPVSYKENRQRLMELITLVSPDVVLSESSKEIVLVEAFAYDLTHRDMKFNERLKSVLPIFAKGENLDVACENFYGTHRLENETDEAFLERSLLSLSKSVTTGAVNPYIYHTKSLDIRILQVAPYRAEDGNITIVWHTLEEDMEEVNALQLAIEKELDRDELRTLCTTSQNVIQASKKTFSVSATLVIEEGLDREKIKIDAEILLRKFVSNMLINEELAISKVSSLLHTVGVKKITITEPIADVIVSKTEIAFLANVILTTEEIADV